MLDTAIWESLRLKLAEAENRRDYEHCAMLALEMSDECETPAIAQAWVSQAQVYATLSLTRQLQLQTEKVMGL